MTRAVWGGVEGHREARKRPKGSDKRGMASARQQP